MKKSIILILTFLLPVISLAQDVQLFEPLNYQQAIKKGTRSRDGKPGPNYRINHSDYDISIKLDTAIRKIFGEETIIYYNQSPDTLKSVVLRLYPNLFKKGTIRNRFTNASDLHDGMVIESLNINNKKTELGNNNTRENGTNMLIYLSEPILPNETLKLWCKWNYPVPVETRDRVGFYKDNSWFIGYFYPQIAVYDDLEVFRGSTGWDYMLFHKGIQQFYNDFNNYKVSIEVPKDFYIWATGDLKNEKEVYPRAILDRLTIARTSDTVVNILSAEDHKNYVPGTTWKFEATNVPDFAFGTSPNYLWDGTSVQIGNKRVFTDAAYHPDAKLYTLAAEMIKVGIKYMSEVYPAVEFPYQHATVFNGKRGGGMEFPMITNCANSRDTTSLYTLLYHEVFHNYMPFMMGFNEKRYGFMDEGMTSYYTDYFQTHFLKSPSTGRRSATNAFRMMAPYADAPLIYSTLMEHSYNTGLLDYLKPQMVYNLFAQMVGEEHFTKAMQVFIERWQGKHPTPWDFFYTMNDALNENYNWFWKAWFFDYAYPDLGLTLNGKILTVERVGTDALPVPVNLVITYTDGTKKELSKSMKVWKDGATEVTIKLNDINKIKSVSVDESSVPDVNSENNSVDVN